MSPPQQLIDSNILVYAYEAESNKRAACAALLAEAMGDRSGVVSVQNLVEFARVITEKVRAPVDPLRVSAIIRDLNTALRVLEYDAGEVSAALANARLYKVHFFDALLIATMERHGVTRIITENTRDFAQVPWLEAHNPLAL